MRAYFKRIFLGIIFFSSVSVLTASSVYALTLKNSETVNLPKTETIEGSYIVGGKVIVIDGTVNGDLVCFGQTVIVNGKINGDVLGAGQTITINGTVTGSVRVAGQFVETNGLVNRNVSVLAQRLGIGTKSVVNLETMFAGQTLDINGTIDKDVWAAAQTINVNGIAKQNLTFQVQDLTVNNNAEIGGNLDYTSPNRGYFASDQNVKGKISYHLPPQKSVVPEIRNFPFRQPFDGGLKFASIIFYGLMSLLAVWFWPKKTEKIIGILNENPGKSVLYGLGIVVFMPIIIALLVITLIGIPLAIILAILFAFWAAVGRIFPAIWLGGKLQQKISPDKEQSLVWSAIVGVIVLWIIFSIPLFGALINILVVFLGLGASFCSFRAKNLQ